MRRANSRFGTAAQRTRDNLRGMNMSSYIIPSATPISVLEARDAFNGLTEKEKFCCHFLSRASWEGSTICLLQTSPESSLVFLLLKELFTCQSVAALRDASREHVSEEEFKVSELTRGGACITSVIIRGTRHCTGA